MPSPTEIIQTVAANILADPEHFSELDSLYIVRIDHVGIWRFDMRATISVDGPAEDQIVSGSHPGSKECVLRTDAETLQEIYEHKLNPQSAFQLGKLKVSGDVQQALKLARYWRETA